MNEAAYCIDIVITWVDGQDPVWLKAKEDEEKNQNVSFFSDSGKYRYRDWDNLQFVFRGIDKYMPWVRKIHFVTFGHIPKWLNTENPKLHIVKHSDFIPAEYLPTFNSNTIELNLHRIPGLAENFINFNDDMFIVRQSGLEDWFSYGLPCDMACVSPQPVQRNAICNIELNNMEIINDHFSISDIKKNLNKWIKPVLYGQHALRTVIFMHFRTIIGIFEPHLPVSYLKSVYSELWSSEWEALNRTCLNKFRSAEDVSEWLMRSWQLMEGKFIPRRKAFGLLVPASNIEMLKSALADKRCKVICINDDPSVTDFEKTKSTVKSLLEELLPEKCSFER